MEFQIYCVGQDGEDDKLIGEAINEGDAEAMVFGLSEVFSDCEFKVVPNPNA